MANYCDALADDCDSGVCFGTGQETWSCNATPEEMGAGLPSVDTPTPAQFIGQKAGCGWHEDTDGF
jgi:hypothetical protein